jgi:phosphoribosylanthranilate isomerase
MLKIKICGLTRRQDVLAAAKLSVNAVGVVFYEPSPRCVTVTQARALLADLPPFLARVGVFVDAGPEQISDYVRQAGLTTVQLHGGATVQQLFEAGCHVPVIRVIHAGADLRERLIRLTDEAVMIDAPPQELPGGTGRVWDWNLVQGAPRPRYLVLAGGLNAENVREAVTLVKPDAVDVSSGVESSPGIKDPAKLAALVAACAQFRTSHQEPL